MAISDLDYSDASDVALIRRTRMGDNDAYGLLHERHAGSARALAWRMSRSVTDADDLVSEGFARVLSALQRGKGPDVAFRPYLLSTIRRLAYDRTDRERREAPVEYELEEPSTDDDPVVDGFERDTAAAAFASLPERWRMVLWHTEVEGQTPAQVAGLLGMSANAVAALAYRAREGLRQAYLAQHAVGEATDPECRYTTERLAAHVRSTLPAAQEARVSAHLDSCLDCQAAYLELADVNTSLRSLTALLLLGPAAGPYLAELATPTAPAALAAAGTGAAPTSGSGGTSGGPGAAGGAATAAPAGASVVALRASARARRLVGVGVAGVVAVGALVGIRAWAAADDPSVSAGADRIDAVAPGPEPTAGPATAADPTPEPPGPGSRFPEVDGASTDGPGAGIDGTSTGSSPPGPSATDGTGGGGSDGADPFGVPDPSERPSGFFPTPTPNPAPGRPSGPTPPTTAPISSPGDPVSPPTTATPPTTTPRPTVPPTTTPPTTVPTPGEAPTTTTTTEPPLPLDPAEPVLTLTSAGALVPDRPGVLVAELENRGAGDAAGVVVTLALRDLTLRGLPRPPADGLGWTCSVADATHLTCTVPALAAGASTSVFVPVAVPGGAPAPGVDGAVTATDATGPVSSGGSTELPTDPGGMAARAATIERGDLAATGNTLLSCDELSPGCPDARDRTGTALDNGDHPMVEVDVDGDPLTTNSSSGELDVPAGAEILAAALYVGGDLDAGTGGAPAPDPGSVGRFVVRPPGGAAVPVEAERVDQLGSRYQAVVDVTALVQAGGAGSWTVGGAQLGTGTGQYGGWSIVVLYADASAPVRSLVLLDGLSEVTAGSSTTLDVGGFWVPAEGATNATVTVVTYEGDAGLLGDQLLVAGQAIVDAANPAGNSFNATASALGSPIGGRDPSAENLFGLDLDRFDVTGALPPGATSTTIELSTDADVFLPGVVAFAVDQ